MKKSKASIIDNRVNYYDKLRTAYPTRYMAAMEIGKRLSERLLKFRKATKQN